MSADPSSLIRRRRRPLAAGVASILLAALAAQAAERATSAESSSSSSSSKQDFTLEVAGGGGGNVARTLVEAHLKPQGIRADFVSENDPSHTDRAVVFYRPNRFAEAGRVAALLPGAEIDLQESGDIRADVKVVMARTAVDNEAEKTAAKEARAKNEIVSAAASPSKIGFEISNGAGKAQLASRFQTYFTGRGVRVGVLSNADRFDYETSVIFYRPERLSLATAVAALFPLPNVRLEELPDQTADVRLLLGRDTLTLDADLPAVPAPAEPQTAQLAPPPLPEPVQLARSPAPATKPVMLAALPAPPTDLPRAVSLPVGKSQLIDLPEEAREVLIGDAVIADVSLSTPRRLFVIGRKAGETNVYVMNGAGREVAQIDISVGPDASVVQGALARALPGVPVSVSSEGGALVLTGTLLSDGDVGRVATVARRFVDADDKVINLLRVGREQQVLIQVRVAEVHRRALKEIGTSIAVNQTTPSQFGAPRVSALTDILGLNPTNRFAATVTLEGIKDLFATLALLEERGFVRNLAEPNLVAVSGESASMLAGGEVPVPVPDRDGIKIEYKPFGVSLAFVPVVLDDGRISLKLSTEVSSIAPERVNIPLLTGSAAVNAFNVRRASSTVEMPSGGSLMIAGLIQNDILSGISGVPGLMDIPIFGQLFRSESFKRNETELVVIVTTSLVQSTSSQGLVAATDAVSPSSDIDTLVSGRLLKQDTPGFVQDADPAAHGPQPFGFASEEGQP